MLQDAEHALNLKVRVWRLSVSPSLQQRSQGLYRRDGILRTCGSCGQVSWTVDLSIFSALDKRASKHLWKKSSRARISLKHKTHKTLKDFKAQRSERNRKTERCRTQKTHLKWPRLHWKKTKEWKRNEARRQEQTQSAAKSESQNQKFSVAPALCGHKASRIRWCPPEPHCRRASQNHSANYTYGEIVCPSDCLAASSTFAFNARNAFDHVLWILFILNVSKCLIQWLVFKCWGCWGL